MEKEITIKEMSDLRDKCASFISEISTPIKKQHGDNLEKYLEKFIKFPGGLSIVSVFCINRVSKKSLYSSYGSCFSYFIFTYCIKYISTAN